MRLLVTGCAGFIGSTTVSAALDRGWDVVGIDALTPYCDEARKRANLAEFGASSRFEFIEAEVGAVIGPSIRPELMRWCTLPRSPACGSHGVRSTITWQ